MSPRRTLLERALEELNSPETLIEKWDHFDPSAIPAMARSRWEAKGAKWQGDPKLLELALAKAVEDVHAELEAIDAISNTRAPRVGRPRSPIEVDAILMAAFLKFSRRGLGLTAAQKEAAKLLGSTTSRVAKGTKRFGQFVRIMEQKFGNRGLQLVALSLFKFGGMLDELVEKNRAVTAAPRRYTPKIASISARRTGAG